MFVAKNGLSSQSRHFAYRIIFGGVHTLLVMSCACVDTEQAPDALHKSVETAIERMYFELGGKSGVQTQKIYSFLQRGVSVYAWFDVDTHHPEHTKGEYWINLSASRWHATVKPIRRRFASDKIYEIWRIQFGGQGRWYNTLAQHRYYIRTVTSDKWGKRAIIYRSGRRNEMYDRPDSMIAIVLSNDQTIELPPIEVRPDTSPDF